MDKSLTENRENQQFVYAGYIAGICILAPTLRGIDLADDLAMAEELFKGDVITRNTLN